MCTREPHPLPLPPNLLLLPLPPPPLITDSRFLHLNYLLLEQYPTQPNKTYPALNLTWFVQVFINLTNFNLTLSLIIIHKKPVQYAPKTHTQICNSILALTQLQVIFTFLQIYEDSITTFPAKVPQAKTPDPIYAQVEVRRKVPNNVTTSTTKPSVEYADIRSIQPALDKPTVDRSNKPKE